MLHTLRRSPFARFFARLFARSFDRFFARFFAQRLFRPVTP
jgi:hypothetical protein